jgi:hypothetical protein
MAILTITARQMDVLREASDAALATALAAHLRVSFPRDAEGFDEKGLLVHAREAIALASQYGLRTKRDYFRFANLTMRFGLAWPTTPELRWLHACMSDSASDAPALRLARLVRRALYRPNSDVRTPHVS